MAVPIISDPMSEVVIAVISAILGGASTEAFHAIRRGVSSHRDKRNKIRIYRRKDLGKLGWTPLQLLEKLVPLDYRLIENLSDSHEGTPEQWAPIYDLYPENWVMLVKGGREVVGYWCFVALTDEDFSRAKRGELLDSEITIDNTVDINEPGHYNLYFTVLALTEECESYFPLLQRAFMESLTELALRGVFFREICADACSRDSRLHCLGFGMERVGSHVNGGSIFQMSMNPWPEKFDCKRQEGLKKLYSKAFKNAAPLPKSPDRIYEVIDSD